MFESKTEHPATMSGGQVTGSWRATLLAGVSAVFVIGQVDIADAQFYRQLYQPRQDLQARPDSKARKANRTSATPSKKDVPIRHPFGENMPKGPLQLMVSVSDQRAFLYSNGVRVGETKVSTGTASHPTPTGVFSIIQKNRFHRSNLYGNAPMFYMHRLTWSGIALHEGHLPGYAASHGCIRMPTDFVSRLWNVSKLGMRVVVARVELTPRDFSHPKLFQPVQKPADTPSTSQGPGELRRSLDTTEQELVRFAQAQPVAGESAIVSDAPSAAVSAPSSVIGADAAVDLSDRLGARAAAEASAIVPSASIATAPAVIEAPAATIVATTPPAAAANEPVTTSTVTVPAPAPMPTEAGRSATAEAPAPTPAAPSSEPERPAISPDELRLPRPAPLRTRTAEPTKLNGQVAVFISGKEKRIYVRHAFVPVFDMPIEIANPGKSLGTHTFTALEVVDGGTRMRWNLISMPLTAGQQHAATVASKKGAQSTAPKRTKGLRGAVVTSDSSNATEALDRVTIPQQAIDRIAELLTPGSSLIITDEGLGRETGRYTEFIVETR